MSEDTTTKPELPAADAPQSPKVVKGASSTVPKRPPPAKPAPPAAKPAAEPRDPDPETPKNEPEKASSNVFEVFGWDV